MSKVSPSDYHQSCSSLYRSYGIPFLFLFILNLSPSLCLCEKRREQDFVIPDTEWCNYHCISRVSLCYIWSDVDVIIVEDYISVAYGVVYTLL